MGENTSQTIFKLSFDSSTCQSLKATKEANSKLWHYRMGHLNFQSLVLLRKQIMVNGLILSWMIMYVKGVFLGNNTGKVSQIELGRLENV